MNYNCKNNRIGFINLIIILIVLVVTQLILFDVYLKKTVRHTNENSIMIEHYFEEYHKDLKEPVMLSVYSFIYTAVGIENKGNVPMVFAYEPTYNWTMEQNKNSILDLRRTNNIYIMSVFSDGDYMKRLLRGDLIEILSDEHGIEYRDMNLKKVIAVPLISDYVIKGFILLGWDDTINLDISNENFKKSLYSFSDDIIPYINHKTLRKADLINNTNSLIRLIK